MKKNGFLIDLGGLPLEISLYPATFSLSIQDGDDSIINKIQQMHRHAFFELFLIFDGKISIVSREGAQQYENCAVCIPPSHDHYAIFDVKCGYVLYFHFPPSKECLPAHLLTQQRLCAGVTSFTLGEEARFYCDRLSQAISQWNATQKSVHLLSLLFGTLFDTDQRSSVAEDAGAAKHRKYLLAIDEYLHAHKQEQITLGDLATHLYLCPKQVSRIIKKEYNCSLSTLITRRRLALSCMLLAQTDIKISQVAKMLGYEYENYFFSLFKKEYGLSPAQYRKESRIV